jgi:hypothetical protein
MSRQTKKCFTAGGNSVLAKFKRNGGFISMILGRGITAVGGGVVTGSTSLSIIALFNRSASAAKSSQRHSRSMHRRPE